MKSVQVFEGTGVEIKPLQLYTVRYTGNVQEFGAGKWWAWIYCTRWIGQEISRSGADYEKAGKYTKEEALAIKQCAIFTNRDIDKFVVKVEKVRI